jgi:hypothetical protein
MRKRLLIIRLKAQEAHRGTNKSQFVRHPFTPLISLSEVQIYSTSELRGRAAYGGTIQATDLIPSRRFMGA